MTNPLSAKLLTSGALTGKESQSKYELVLQVREIYRSYVRSYLEEEDLTVDNTTLFLHHLALINHSPLDYVLATCFSFFPPNELQVGMSHRVLKDIFYSAFHN